ncbi:MAG: hypothetical protein EU539_07410 [Promethearchaeota archaeon]|nr:MAG: hypothetical protein EU539_07410 [Candidatus Lokiarchaeota archaeon]
MQIYLLGVRGGLTKVPKVDFNEDKAYLIDDYKTIYLWFGNNIPKKQKEFCTKKADKLNIKRDNSASIQIMTQKKEYGSFLAIKDILKEGMATDHSVARRPELEINYDDTIELIDAGLDPDMTAEITLKAHDISAEKKSYKELCRLLAEKQLIILKGKRKVAEKEIKEKAKEIFNSSCSYEELCWLIAELDLLIDKKNID